MATQGTDRKRRRRVRLSSLLSFVDCARPQAADPDLIGTAGFSRVVHCNHPDKHDSPPNKYPNNYISTTKYSVVTFFPKALFEQFRRVANFYFLVAAILGLTPLSPYNALSLVAPLVLVVGVSMLKEGLEDYNRWKADQEVNTRLVSTHTSDGSFEPKQWQDLRVGDIVKVEKDAFFPADLMLLSSSYEDGICYVETMNLDGETNLKLRKGLEITLELDDHEKVKDFNATINCEDPNASLYTFVGNMTWNEAVTSIEPLQILLRDSKLRNTTFVYGVCIFTGHDTKVMQNSTAPRSKRSRVERRMDRIVYLLFGILLLLTVTGSTVFGIRTGSEMASWWYLKPQDTTVYYDPERAALSAILQAITDLVLYGYLIPISLYVTIEVVKTIQVAFLSRDIHMYHAETDMRAHARTSNLNEELGQVDTVLSDKTGTLTCNQMEFLKCSIGGTRYGRGVTEVELATARRLGKDPREMEEFEDAHVDEGAGEETGDGDGASGKGKVKGYALKDSRLSGGRWVNEPNSEVIRQFLTILAVCHTAIPEEDEETGVVKYEAESPDEASFVVAAQQLGFEFFQRSQRVVSVREPSSADPSVKVEREYEILQLLEFNSTRKRMSVVVKDPEGSIFVFCKGADSVIFERLAPGGKEYLAATRSHLIKYGDAGLRTLALAYRQLDKFEYEEWNEQYRAAKETLGPERVRLLEEASEKIEQNLVLVGATAVEDKLQKGVPETIDRLAQAGIKIWVLTGDKLETAINIGYACSLLRQDMKQIVISLDTPKIQAVEESGDKENLKTVCLGSVAKQLTEGASSLEAQGSDPDQVFALIIDGKSLAYALDPALKPILLALAIQCASVICCRVSPKQKALVTRLVKEGTGKITLAIGDGANDVGMIQEADIGVGISGLEGQQAVMASDFAIAQFRFLERLLLVHGHWCYKRITNMVTYFFYKNLSFGMTLFYYNAYSVFSGQVMFNSWYSASFNVFFSALPVGAMGALEQDVPAKTCLNFPLLYQGGVKNIWFTWPRIIFWMLNGIYASLAGFWFTILAMSPQAFRSNGFLPELPAIGFVLFNAIVWTINLQIFLIIDYATWIHHLLIWGSVALYYIFAIIFDFMWPDFTTTGYRLFSEVVAPSPLCWVVLLLLPPLMLMPYFVYKAVQLRFNPMDHQIVQEILLLRKDVEDPTGWQAEGSRAVIRANVGFTAAVEAVVKRLAKKGQIPRDGSTGQGVIQAAKDAASELEK